MGGGVNIIYYKQENSGKHIAINKGVELASGELFFIVDSDDYLPENAIHSIEREYSHIVDDDKLAGVCGNRVTFKGKKIGSNADYDVMECSPVDFRYLYKYKGDMAEVVKTEIMRQFPFPVIEGEKFCPEAVVWNRIGTEYKLRYFNEGIYCCEYLPDGLSTKITGLRMSNPEASKICYSELYRMKIPFLQKMKAAINYWRFALCSKRPFTSNPNYPQLLLLLPLGWIFHLKDIRDLRRQQSD